MRNKYCVECGKRISRFDAKRCKSCARKGVRNPNYRHGQTMKEYFCIDCNKKLQDYHAKRCSSCARIKEYKNPKKNPNYIHGLDKFPYPTEFKKIRNQVKDRDNHECQLCHILENIHEKLYNK